MKKLFIKVLAIASLLTGVANAQGNFQISNTEFKALYNDFRSKAITPTPWAGSYWAYRHEGIAMSKWSSSQKSPVQLYEETFGTRGKAEEFEKKNHSCNAYSGAQKESCDGWWGHCNAWSAAAIKNKEPREAKLHLGKQWDVSHRKGLLTEMWMSSDALFVGDTDKSKPTNPSWVCDPRSPNYSKFWDVSPRDFFLIFTNYLGMQNQSVVIDRFTGDQVWNQPIVAFKTFDIDPARDLLPPKQISSSSPVVYPVKMKVRIYWANDGVEGNYISEPFDLATADSKLSDPAFAKSYEARDIEFTLFLDAPVTMSGKKIASAGRVVGNGVWKNQEICNTLTAAQLDQGHPDFIWRPTSLIRDTYGQSANPYIDPAKVQQIEEGDQTGNGGGGSNGGGGNGGNNGGGGSGGNNGGGGSGGNNGGGGNGGSDVSHASTRMALKITLAGLPSTEVGIKRVLNKALTRGGLSGALENTGFQLAATHVDVVASFKGNVTTKTVGTILKESGLFVVSVKIIR